jgi:hypothetical protein
MCYLISWLRFLFSYFSQTSSLYLGAAFMRAILMNHIAHSEANEAAKVTEVILKGEIDDMEIVNQN